MGAVITLSVILNALRESSMFYARKFDFNNRYARNIHRTRRRYKFMKGNIKYIGTYKLCEFPIFYSKPT